MKTAMVSALVILGLAAAPLAWGAGKRAHKETHLTMDQVPAAVKATLEKEGAGAKVESNRVTATSAPRQTMDAAGCRAAAHAPGRLTRYADAMPPRKAAAFSHPPRLVIHQPPATVPATPRITQTRAGRNASSRPASGSEK